MRTRLAFGAVLCCALMLPGCGCWNGPRIDPSGRRVFVPANNPTPAAAQPGVPVVPASAPGDYSAAGAYTPGPNYRLEPSPQTQTAGSELLTLAPNPVVAPVGSEVILLASVKAIEGYLLTNERVEWSIAPGGVGYLTGVGHNGVSDFFFGVGDRGKKSSTFAVGSTSRNHLRLTRGTPNPGDDVFVRAGQAWVAIASPVEGTTFVTAQAPDIPSWDRNKQTGVIHWLDADWQFPAPAIQPAGSRHTLTTTISRRSDRSPVAGWKVQYQIADGPDAGFAPSGAKTVEVETNSQGHATVELTQGRPAAGTNRIVVQITRPASVPGTGGKPLAIAAGSTLASWTAPQIAVRVSGPTRAAVGAKTTLQIAVSNPGDMAAEEVLASYDPPDGTSYSSSNPPGQQNGRRVQWRLGKVAGRETRNIELVVQADRAGSLSQCVEVAAADGLRARDCLPMTAGTETAPSTGSATSAGAAPAAGAANLKINGPSRITLGDKVTFEIVVTNNLSTPLDNMVFRDTFDPGLESSAGKGKIESDKALQRLGPRQSGTVKVDFKAVKIGQACQTIELKSAGTVLARERLCVTIVEGATLAPTPGPGTSPYPRPGASATPSPATPPSTPALTPPADTGRSAGPQIRLVQSGPKDARVGEEILVSFTITNLSRQKLTNVSIKHQPGSLLKTVQASHGAEFVDYGLVWTLPELEAEKGITYQVKFSCLRDGVAKPRTTVMSREGWAQDEMEVRIGAGAGAIMEQPPIPRAESKLTVSIDEDRDPVGAGKDVSYKVRVTNAGLTTEQDVRVVVQIPVGMRPTLTGVNGPVAGRVEGQAVRFEPLAELAAGKDAVFSIVLRTEQKGRQTVRAEVTSRLATQPRTAEESTDVF